MNLIEFQKEAWRTCPSLGITNSANIRTFSDKMPTEENIWSASSLLNSIHMTMGMCTEIGEIAVCLKMSKSIDKINLQEELADVLWYFVNYANFYKIDITNYKFSKELYFVNEYEQYPNLRVYDLMLIHASDLLDYDKKALAYNKPRSANDSFYLLFQAISDMFCTYVLDPEKSMQNVIDKLRVRYPEKFSSEAAINRDLEKERTELEK